MMGIIKVVLSALLFSALLSTTTLAATHTAATCNVSDVQTAINAAVAGDTVVIPAGTCSWTTGITWSAPANVVLQGQTTVTGTCAPGGTCTVADNTTITDNISRNSSCSPDPALLTVTTSATGTFRMTGISFAWGTGTNPTCAGDVRVMGSSQQLRIDHVHFNQLNDVGLDTNGQIYGVVDHCVFDLPANTTYNGARIEAAAWGGGSNNFGDGSWNDSTTFGSQRFVFFENDVFNGFGGSNSAAPYANDCTQGGRWVFRYSMFNGPQLQTHPTGGGARHRGCRAEEVYQNTFSGSNSLPSYNVFFLSSATALIWGNAAPKGYENFLSLREQRGDGDYVQSAPPNGFGVCGTQVNGTGSAWDASATTSSGYPCIDQPGRGYGDLLQGDFPNMCDVTNGACQAGNYNGTWPNQALEPIYEWMDTWTQVPGYPSPFVNLNPNANFSQNKDFYLWCNASSPTGCTSFNGTVGVGSGLLSSRPSTCTKGVAYWATDTTTLYQCSAANTWSAYYTPYTYPHPLTQGTGTTVDAPTSLSVTVH
jgi:hypothetical protein